MAPSSNAHTYRLLIFKELYLVLLPLPCASNRFVRRSRRKESMRCFVFVVNVFFAIPQSLLWALVGYKSNVTRCDATLQCHGLSNIVQVRGRLPDRSTSLQSRLLYSTIGTAVLLAWPGLLEMAVALFDAYQLSSAASQRTQQHEKSRNRCSSTSIWPTKPTCISTISPPP